MIPIDYFYFCVECLTAVSIALVATLAFAKAIGRAWAAGKLDATEHFAKSHKWDNRRDYP